MSKAAKDWVKSYVISNYTEPETIPNVSLRFYFYKDMLESFNAGVASVKKSEWHNLEENPNDLPDDDRDVLVMHKSGICYRVAKYYKYKKYWWSNDMDSELGCIARWKELE